MRTVDRLYRTWNAENTGERFGQWFINRYVKVEDSITSCMWEANVQTAVLLVQEWCRANCYETEMPPLVRKVLDNKFVAV